MSVRRALLAGALVFTLLMPGAGAAEDPAAAPVLNWQTGAGKSYGIPALEVGGFIVGLNAFDRLFIDPEEDYDTDLESIWKNLKTAASSSATASSPSSRVAIRRCSSACGWARPSPRT